MTLQAHTARPAGQPIAPRRPSLRQSPALRRLASLKLAVVLMVVIGMILAFATFYEARHTSAEAQVLVYRSPWFCLLLVALAVNIFAATIIRWPFPLKRIGFPVTHLGILVILAGAVITNRIGMEGQLRITERSASDRVALPGLIVRVEPVSSASQQATPDAVDVELPMDQSRPTRGIGSTTDPADLGLTLRFAQFIPHSQWRQVAGDRGSRWIASPATNNPDADPALLLETSIGRVTESNWLAWQRPATIDLAGRAFQLTLCNPQHPLPFEVYLDRFERETYPGTNQAAMFTSHVILSGPTIDGPRAGTISMNRPLRIAGYTFFQSGFHTDAGRSMTILTVSRDPGKPFVYAGFLLVCIGVVLMVVVRMAGRSRATASVPAKGIPSVPSEVRIPCAA